MSRVIERCVYCRNVVGKDGYSSRTHAKPYCSFYCMRAYIVDQMTEQRAEATAEDIGTDDSSRSLSEDDTDSSMDGFVVPDHISEGDADSVSDQEDNGYYLCLVNLRQ